MEPEIPLLKLQDDIYMALKSWHEASPQASPLNYLQLFQQARQGGLNNARQVTNQILLEALESLAVEHKKEADLLRRHFLDGMVMHAVANWLNVGESTAYRRQQAAIRRLALIIQANEAHARTAYQNDLEKRLRLPPEVQLFGIEEHLNNLLNVLASPEPIWLISLEGLGGIGKTALANAFIRQSELSGKFANIAWVSAKQQEFLPNIGFEPGLSAALTGDSLTDSLLEYFDQAIPLTQSPQEKRIALTRLLKKAPYLIVIDNLETVVDYQTLLPVLRQLANPSKFLLTSRHSLRAYPDVFCFSLTELNQTECLRFMKYEAKIRGLPMLARAHAAELQSIYEVVGGNPLALKLVMGQISVLPLSRVLDSLKQARGKNIEELYTYIYWQAWHMLDPVSQQTLLIMPLAQDGTLDQLLILSQVDFDELQHALQQLVNLSLLEVRGDDLELRRYTIHRLTETFLLNEAIKWRASS